MKDTKKMLLISLMVAFSMVLYSIESLLPPLNFISPGAKLGLSNIISLTCLYIFGFKEAFAILFMRIMLSSLLFSGMASFLYSISGGILSIIAMAILKKMNIESVSIVGVSITGSLFFNIGQLFVASVMISNTKIFYYLPYMSFVSIATGIFVGLTSKILIDKLSKVIREVKCKN